MSDAASNTWSSKWFRALLLTVAAALLLGPAVVGCGESYRIGPSPDHGHRFPGGGDRDGGSTDDDIGADPVDAVLYTNLSDTVATKQKYDRWNVKPAMIVYQHFIAPDEPKHAWSRPDLTRRWIEEHIPEDWDGPICLDWEIGSMKVLKAGPSHRHYRTTVDDMIRLAREVKTWRPNAKVGYYGLPLREYWNQDEQWKEMNERLAPIIAATDMVFIPIYDFYGDMDRLEARDFERHGEYVREALRLAGERPVILYTWDHYHGSADQFKGRIPESELRRHVHTLLRVEHDGRRPSGVVAWSNGKERSNQRYERFYRVLDEAIRGVRFDER